MTLQVIEAREVLNNEFKIYGDLDNPLFLAKDVAEWIEHSKVTMMLETIDDDEKLKSTILTSGQNRQMWFLTEDGLYEVLMQSRKPIAKKFKKEVKKILKEIRKNGMYATVPQLDPDASIELQMFDLLGKALARQERATKELQVTTKRLEEKVENMEAHKVIEVQNAPVQEVLMLNRKLYTTQEIAEPFGFNGTGGVYRLNQILHDKRIVYPTRKKNGKPGFVWKLYKKHQGKGYKDLSSVASSQKWTEEGKLFLESVLKSI